MAGEILFDRLIRKEVSLGAIRERPRPADHIGLSIAPFLPVATDDVIFDYIRGGYSESMAPARAEDAEAELAQKDELTSGQGRASVLDWALKDKYTPSDISRFREAEFLLQRAQGAVGAGAVPLTFTGSTVSDFQQRVAREDARRKRALDNRIEWLIMTGLSVGEVAYNDGRIKWTVNYQRPSDQTAQAPLAYHGGPTDLWSAGTAHDPIGNLKAVQDLMYARYGIRRFHAYTSQKVLDSLWLSSRFLAAAGVPVVGGTASLPLDVNYLVPSFGPDAAVAAVTRATGITFTVYDSIYRTRDIGSAQWKNSRFVDERDIILVPDASELAATGELYPGADGNTSDNQIGFAKTLTSPHPEGNWQSGFYEFEYEKVDPWIHVRGSGIKAMPVFPQLELSYTMRVLASATVPVYPSTVND